MANNQTANNQKPSTGDRAVQYVTEVSKGAPWATIVIAGGIVFLGYELLKSAGLVGTPTSTVVTPECPKGPKYNINFWETCDPNYLEETNIFGIHTGICDCQSTTPVGTKVASLEGEKKKVAVRGAEMASKGYESYKGTIRPLRSSMMQSEYLPFTNDNYQRMGTPYHRRVPGLPQEDMKGFGPGDGYTQMSINDWTPMSKEEKLRLGIKSK